MRRISLEQEIEAFNSRSVKEYVKETKRGLSQRRKNKIEWTLCKVLNVHIKKRFGEISKDDVEDWIDNLKADELPEEAYQHPRKKTAYDGFEDGTKTSYLKITKPYLKWLHQEDEKWASWIKTGNYLPTVGPEDILTQDELDMIRSILKTPRDKALFETLYESALRPMEFLALSRNDLEFEQDGVWIHIRKGKTKYPRDVFLVHNARALLTQWVMNEHPLWKDSQFPLWVDMSSNTDFLPLQAQGLRRFIVRVAELAKVKKRVVPYTLRHTRCTDLARLGMNEANLCEIAGWKIGSKMPSVYIHLSKRDTKPAIMKLYNLQSEQIKPIPQPKTCTSCKRLSPSDAHICINCGSPLDPETAVKMLRDKIEWQRSIEKELQENRAFRKLAEEFIRQQMKLSPVELGEALIYGDALRRKNIIKGGDANFLETMKETEARIKELDSDDPLKDGEIYRSRNTKIKID